MPAHPEFLAGFDAALRGGALPPGLTASAPDEVALRFAVYRNNVAVGLSDALAARFPVICRLVGADFFAAMARLHAEADLNAGRHDGACVRRVGADAAEVLIEQILKLGALTLETRSAHVGDVVRDDLDIELLGHHACGGDTERLHGLSSLLPANGTASGRGSEFLNGLATHLVGLVDEFLGARI